MSGDRLAMEQGGGLRHDRSVGRADSTVSFGILVCESKADGGERTDKKAQGQKGGKQLLGASRFLVGGAKQPTSSDFDHHTHTEASEAQCRVLLTLIRTSKSV
jgi:hypothetical protein